MSRWRWNMLQDSPRLDDGPPPHEGQWLGQLDQTRCGELSQRERVTFHLSFEIRRYLR